MNGRHPDEARRRRNADLAPYASSDDPRLTWMTDTFLKYFDDWEEYVNSLELSNADKQKRLLSRQTRSALYVTVNGFVDMMRWLFEQPDRPPYVLSGVFNQDRLEIYFGHIRGSGGSNDHPDLRQVNKIATVLNFVDASNLSAKRGANVTN